MATNMFMLTYAYFIVTIFQLMMESRSKMIRDCKLGASDFKSILQSECYVDKSLFIKRFLADKLQGRVVYVTAPDRFGKTLNLQMFKTFLATRDGNKHVNLTEGCELFKKYNLLLYKSYGHKLFNVKCGRYPLVYLDFQQIKKNRTLGILEGLRYAVHECFVEHNYLNNNAKIGNRRRSLFTDYLTAYQNLTRTQLLKSMPLLLQMLYTHYRKKVIILIDDYDAPYWSLIYKVCENDKLEENYLFLNKFMAFLKKSQYLNRALISGSAIFPGFSKVDNVITCPFLATPILRKLYGLTSKEVKQKLIYFKIQNKKKEIDYYYDGYRTLDRKVKVYNPWSVMNYLQTEVFNTYWNDGIFFGDLQNILLKGAVRDTIIRVLKDRNVTIDYKDEITYADIKSLKEVMHNRRTYDKKKAKIFVRAMLESGYFTTKMKDTKKIWIHIPNESLRNYFLHYVYSKLYFTKYYNLQRKPARMLLNALNMFGVHNNKTVPRIFRKCIANLLKDENMTDDVHVLKGYIFELLNTSTLFSLTKKDVYAVFKREQTTRKIYFSGVRKEREGDFIAGRARVDIMTKRNSDGAGVIIMIRFGEENARKALSSIFKYQHPCYRMFELQEYRNEIKENRVNIGLHVNTETRTLRMCYLLNEKNYDLKTCI